jgi:hypothetical protein
LNRGNVIANGDVSTATDEYRRLNAGPLEGDQAFTKFLAPFSRVDCTVSESPLRYGDHLKLRFAYEAEADMPSATLRVCFYDPIGTMVAEWDSRRDGAPINIVRGHGAIEAELGPLLLKNGDYYLGIQLHEQNFLLIPFWSYKAIRIMMAGDSRGYAPYQISKGIAPQ